MDTYRKTALTAGLLFIVATVTDVLGTQLWQPIVSAPDHLSKVSANASQVTVGALLEFIAALACAGIAVSLFPVLRKWSPGLAVGSVVFRTLEAMTYIVGVLSLLALLALSRQFAGAAAADSAALRAGADLLVAVRQQVADPGLLAFGVGALMYYVVFYQSRLIPRWLSGWGIAAIILMMGAGLLAWFTHNSPTDYFIVMMPIAVQEMVLALWLIVKGFDANALRSTTMAKGKTPVAA